MPALKASVLVSLAAFALIGGMQNAQATTTPAAEQAPQVILKQEEASHPERILLAYYKLAGAEPEYARWAALSPFLDKASDADTPAIVNRETNRLSRAYTEFDLTEPLVVHTSLNLDDYGTINGVLNFNEFSPATFFNYTLYGEYVAVIPKDIAHFGTLPMGKEKMEDMLSKARGSKIEAELLLKPVVADAKEPFMHEGKPYKLLLAEIAEIRFWAPTAPPELLWTYRADWYQPKIDQTLMDLKPADNMIPTQ